MRILIATDAWHPQVMGVVTTLVNTVRELRQAGHDVMLATHEGLRTFPCPSYPRIRLALAPGRDVRRKLATFAPDAVHIATEGPIGLAARRACLDAGQPFTTAYHTQFPEYVHARWRLPLAISYRWLRWFHAPASAVMVPTRGVHDMLAQRGFARLAHWTRGVDTEAFSPGTRAPRRSQRPIFLYVGRLAVEKSIDHFLALDLPGTKWVVGDGPERARLEARYPDAVFYGMQHGKALVTSYREADVLVFPSRTDTFGLVMAEAMACGTPVAAYPVTGPIDVVHHGRSGVLDRDLRAAALACLDLDRDGVREDAMGHSWSRATAQFIGNLAPVRAMEPPVLEDPVAP